MILTAKNIMTTIRTKHKHTRIFTYDANGKLGVTCSECGKKLRLQHGDSDNKIKPKINDDEAIARIKYLRQAMELLYGDSTKTNEWSKTYVNTTYSGLK